MPSHLSGQDYVRKWRLSEVKESASAQENFIDICHLIGHGTPVELDPKGEWFTFEAGAEKLGGEQGYADVWKKEYFAWEYKGKHENLEEAYKQLLQYREALLNPPLLVVSDMEVIKIHTNFTNTAKHVYVLDLEDLLSREGRDILYKVFNDPSALEIPITPDQVTEEAAGEFAKLADILRKWGEDPHTTAHFLIRLLFCLFAEDIGLLPRGLFTHLVEQAGGLTSEFTGPLGDLFSTMATGGHFGADKIVHFDGSLFDDEVVLEVPSDGLEILRNVCRLDWSSIEPAILGTLFERSLDPSRRAELGAHYTSREDIELVVEPVLMKPIREKWSSIQKQALKIAAGTETAPNGNGELEKQLESLLGSFMEEVASTKVLDPACGSGNFLYVALQRLLDLQKEVISFSRALGLDILRPSVSPEQLFGIELNTYAYELAQTTVWIGYIQWVYENGFDLPGEPILRRLGNFLNEDAIISHSGEVPSEPDWPEADVIVGNPPYLGNKKMKPELGDEYVNQLRKLYEDRLPGTCDLVCYWFEKSREMIESKKSRRAGLLATQSIRKGTNRVVVDRIKETGDIFWAVSDREWVLDGATVHVSMIGFDNGSLETIDLDGISVDSINADLTAGIDVTQVPRLKENKGVAFQGVIKSGPFDIERPVAQKFLADKGNPNGRPNSDVIKPWLTGQDVADRPKQMFIIDFGIDMPIERASEYVRPFNYVKENVKPQRDEVKRKRNRENWWIFAEARPGMRGKLESLQRYIATVRHSKHRIFVWVERSYLPGSALVVFARDDDYFLGVLHSRVHEIWSRVKGSQVREAESGFRYTPSSTFEPFPFPWPIGQEPTEDPRYQAIAAAAANLVLKRRLWIFPEGEIAEEELEARTLTALYNEYPTWLELCHEKLDDAVLDAYGWAHDLSDEGLLKKLLDLNEQRSGGT